MKNNKGFTLIEVISVIALIGLIMTIAVPSISKFQENANMKSLKTKQKAIELAAINYAQKNSFLMMEQEKSGACSVDFNKKAETFTCKMTVGKLVELRAYSETKKGQKTESECKVENPLGGCLDEKVITLEINNDNGVSTASLNID